MNQRSGRHWSTRRFDTHQEEPLGPLANLMDLMLVFACGLIAALIGMSGKVEEHFVRDRQIIETGRELPEDPRRRSVRGDGFESIGQVYKNPDTGELILIGE